MGWQPDPRGCPPEAVPPRGITAPKTLERMAVHAARDGMTLEEAYESKAWWDRRWVALQRAQPWWPWGEARRRWAREVREAAEGCELFGRLLRGWMQASGVEPDRRGLPIFTAGKTDRVMS